MRRWNANQVVLFLLATVLLLAGMDIGRRLVAEEPEVAAPKPPSPDPAFKVGDPAPDFVLPDERGHPRRLTELVKGDTILTFSCGCNHCREFQSYLAQLYKTLGSKVPAVISINTTHPDAHEAWLRETKLKQTFLYGKHSAPELLPYRGAPCPRAFRLDGEAKVRYIGPSPAQPATNYVSVAYDMAEELDFKIPGRPGATGKHTAPRIDHPEPLPTSTEAPTELLPTEPMTPPGPSTRPQSSTLPPGHHPGDGHNH